MDFEIYCDESGLEALTRKDAHLFTAIGGIWMPADFRDTFKSEMNTIKAKYNVYGELKWNKVSPAFYELYKEIITYFLNCNELRFRAILIESKTVDHIKFNQKDAELGFYKFYYQLLHHWILDFNSYDIFLDYKLNRNKGRLNELKTVLCASNISAKIGRVQALDSSESLGIQLADILTGIVSAKFNKNTTSKAKSDLIALVEKLVKREVAPTTKGEEKLNVFRINLQGGW